jgi:hypothetical protein
MLSRQHAEPSTSEQLRSVLRYFGWAVMSMGIFTLLSGGVNVISSCLVITLGQQWLEATSTRLRTSLSDHLDELQLLSGKDCRGCCRHCCSGQCRGVFDNIRGLAIAAITFGVLEMIALMPTLAILGNEFTLQYGVAITQSPYYPYNSYVTCNPQADLGIGQWLFFALGHNTLAAPLNIAWGAITLNFIAVLTSKSASSTESTSLLKGEVKPIAFMTPTPASELAGSDKV